MTRKTTLNLALLVATLVISLFMGEALIRFAAPQDMSGSWLVYGPRGLLLNKANGRARHQRGPIAVTYHFNKWHQRSAAPSAPPGVNKRRVLVLGDSFTFGWLLAKKDTYVDRLQALAIKHFAGRGQGEVEFLNAATGGWGAADYLAYLESFGPEIKPDMVLVFVSFEDFERAERRGLYVLREQTGTALRGRDLSSRQSGLKKFLNRLPGYQWLLEHSHLVQMLRGLATKVLGVGHGNSTPAKGPANNKAKLARLGEALMARLDAWAKANGAALLVMTTGWPSVDYPWLKAVMEKTGIAFFDLKDKVAAAVTGNPGRYVIPGDLHPNKQGAALIADAAWPHIRDRLSR